MLRGLAALGRFAVANVAAHGQNGGFAVEVDQRSVDVDRDDAAVLGDVPSFTGEPADGALAARAFREAGRERRFIEIAGVETEELLARVAEALARRGVG